MLPPKIPWECTRSWVRPESRSVNSRAVWLNFSSSMAVPSLYFVGRRSSNLLNRFVPIQRKNRVMKLMFIEKLSVGVGNLENVPAQPAAYGVCHQHPISLYTIFLGCEANANHFSPRFE